MGSAGFPVSQRPWLRAHPEWTRLPGLPQVVPLRAVVAVPELQLSTSWVDFGTCFVSQQRVREVYLMNLSGCRSYWTMLMGMSYSPTYPLFPYRVVTREDPRKRAPVPCPCMLAPRAGTTWDFCRTASPPIPHDLRLALPRSAEQDQRCRPGGGGSLLVAVHGAACTHVSSLPFGAGQQEPPKAAVAFGVSPSSGLLEARSANAPPTSIALQVFFTARYSPFQPPPNCPQGLDPLPRPLLTSAPACSPQE